MPNVGDRVVCRSPHGDVLHGTVLTLDPTGGVHVRDGDGSPRFAPTSWTVEVETPALPPEPAVGTVLRDQQGDLWWRDKYGWGCSITPDCRYSWGDVQGNAPLTPLVELRLPDRVPDNTYGAPYGAGYAVGWNSALDAVAYLSGKGRSQS